MKKILMIGVCLAVTASMAACSPTQPKTQSSQANTESVAVLVEGETGGADDKVPDPNAEPAAPVMIYYSKNGAPGLTKAMDDVPELTPENLMGKLKNYGVVDNGVEVISFTHADGSDDATLDLSGLTDESQKTIVSIGNTFIENYELAQITITVNGTALKDANPMRFNHEFADLK